MIKKQRLDQLVFKLGLASSRSQAESYIKLGLVTVDGQVAAKPGLFTSEAAEIKLTANEQYVSRAGLKLASIAGVFDLDFSGKVVLDVGSSTGGFTDYSLQKGAKLVIAVDVGTDQMHPKLRENPKVILIEQTNILDVDPPLSSGKAVHGSKTKALPHTPDLVLVDLSFVSLRDILPHLARITNTSARIVAMLKPQFETGAQQKNKGVVKNDRLRRQILRDFEEWARKLFVIRNKADSKVKGSKGNVERFYLLSKKA